MPRTGSTSFIWTACGSTRRSRSSTPRRPHCWRRSRGGARRGAGDRSILSSRKTNRRTSRLLRPSRQGGFGFDALWNDDFHHAAVVALTGRREAYYTDYCGTPQEFVSLAKWGFLYQGQRYSWQQRAARHADARVRALRGSSRFSRITIRSPTRRRGRGERIHQRAQPGHVSRADGVVAAVARARRCSFRARSSRHRRRSCTSPITRGDARRGGARGPRRVHEPVSQRGVARISSTRLPIPHDEETFRRCKLRHDERERHTAAVALHRDLLRLRREDPVLRRARHGRIDGAVLSDRAFVLRWFAERSARGRGRAGARADDRLLVVNLGARSASAIRRRSRCWRRPPARRGRSAGRAKIRRTAARARRRSTPTSDWRIPGQADRAFWLRAVAMSLPVRRMPLSERRSGDATSTREWLVTNGLGGYASGTISGIVTRRYHGLLVAALPAPIGRHGDAQPRGRADPSAVGAH